MSYDLVTGKRIPTVTIDRNNVPMTYPVKFGDGLIIAFLYGNWLYPTPHINGHWEDLYKFAARNNYQVSK